MSKITEEKGFLPRIEALRGIAALSVAICHSFLWLSVGTQRALWNTPVQSAHGVQGLATRAIAGLFGGGAAVDMFFVLSGFVLARSLRNAKPSLGMYAHFIIRRVFRIYPALIASLLITVTYLLLFFGGYKTFPQMSEWDTWYYTEPPTIQSIINNIALTSFTINASTWTLKIEMLASLIFPIFFFVCKSSGRTITTCILVILFAASGNQTDVAHFFYLFVLGIVAQLYGPSILRAEIVATPAPLLLLGACLLLAPELFTLGHERMTDLSMGFGAFVLVLITAYCPDLRYLKALDFSWIRFLGRVSYSFYLIHLPVLLAVGRFMLEHTPNRFLERAPFAVMLMSALISITIGLLIAALLHRSIEKPFNSVGKKLTQRLAISASRPS